MLCSINKRKGFEFPSISYLCGSLVIISPLFDKVTIQLDNRYYPGKQVVIETKNNSPENVYIQKMWWNGKTHSSFQLSHEEFVKGGHLVLELGSEPNKQWGS